jgi:hypothetical protein
MLIILLDCIFASRQTQPHPLVNATEAIVSKSLLLSHQDERTNGIVDVGAETESNDSE